jgi:Tfp pilus assembly protein PilX
MNPWLIVGFVLAIAGSFVGGYYKGNSAGMAKVQQQWDNEKAVQYEAYAQAQEAAREKEQSLQAQADRLREEKDNEIRNLNARATALSNSLRDRPSRTPTVASTVSSSTGLSCPTLTCTGAELSREDGEFLAGEAARAEEARTLLKQCYDQYNAVRQK